MQHFGKGAVRVVKNYTKGYSDTQAKVRDATSNDPWGPSGTQMNEIAQMTYNQGDFVEIMEMLDKRLNDKGKNWRHVFKSLTLLDYLLHQGSENVIIYFKDNLYVIKTLKEFQYVDEDGKDQGGNVRAKAKDITSLLQDEGRLRTERRARASMRERMVKGAGEDGEFDEAAHANRPDENGRRRGGGADDEMRRAIEESKKSLRQDQLTAEEKDLIQALKLSEEEEAARLRAAEASNANALFDDQQQLPPPVNNNPFPFLDAPPQQQQLQPQFTMIQPQFTSFNPYQQQAEMEAEYMRQQQQQAFLQQQQQEEWMRQQQMMQQQQMQQQQQQDDWMRQQQMMQQQQQLVAQPTGFGNNNPFAQTQQAPPPPLPSFSPSTQQPPSFNLPGTYDNGSPQPSFQSSPSPVQQQQPGGPKFKVKVNDGENTHLANLFANRDDGQDTFGNTGALRYGHTQAGRAIVAQQTGHNPFARQQQQQNEQPFFNV
ncbi:epsin domain-containing protein [Mycena alexandri]|uniref:Epsin domain-containing protein n=1 Tax=Mycena alexandri TaxID=1745969 RepID=A0AAD6WRY3_9AGAR|nr:epsin domain-containing protein [Mycena alexandri]